MPVPLVRQDTRAYTTALRCTDVIDSVEGARATEQRVSLKR
jgi:hypothetical protein